MECRELEPLLQTYLDGEVEGAEQIDIESHVLRCPSCRARIESERGFRSRLRASVSHVAAPPALRARIQSSLKRERRWAATRRLVSPDMVAVMAVAACAGFVAWLSGRSLLRPLLDDAVARHTHHLPVEIQGDPSRVQQWFADKVDFNVRLPALRNVSLEGARLSNIRDHSAAYVVYGGPGAHRVSLFVFDDPHAPLDLGVGGHRERIADRDVILANDRGYNVAFWRDRQIVYSLVSDLDEQDIVGLLGGQRSEPSEVVVPLPAAARSLEPVIQPTSLHAP